VYAPGSLRGTGGTTNGASERLTRGSVVGEPEVRSTGSFASTVESTTRPVINSSRSPILPLAGWQAWRLHPREPQGIGTVCGTPKSDTGGEMWRRARWHFIKPAAGGTIDYEQADAWFSYAECKAYVMQRVKTPAQPTAGGLGYAFRTRCPACKLDDRDLLHVITPSQEFNERQSTGTTRDFHAWRRSIEHSVLPLHLGTAFVTARLDTNAIQRFKDGGIPLTRTSGAVLSVHISQGVRDPEPVAMVYVEDAPGHLKPRALITAEHTCQADPPLRTGRRRGTRRPPRIFARVCIHRRASSRRPRASYRRG
jgi:hypothetical protein